MSVSGRRIVSGIVPAGAPLPGDAHGRRGLYERALADPLFRRRFEQAYAGADEPLDALWWLDRPLTDGPSGASAPAALAAEARRVLYGPGTDPAALAEYERAAAAAERSRAVALAALSGIPVERTAGGREPPPVEAAPPAVAAVPSRNRRVLVLVAGVAGAALIAGAALGFGLARAMPVPTPRIALGEHFQQTVAGHDALSLLEHPQVPYDLLGGPAAAIDTTSSRRLVVIGSTRFLAARTFVGSGGVCLIAASGDVRDATVCDTLARFEARGLIMDRSDGLPAPLVKVRWQPDGKVVWWSTDG